MATKICRTAVIVIFIVLVCLAGTLCFALNQPRFIAGAALYVFKQKPSAVTFKEITIESLHWSSWKDLTLHNVRIRCKINKDIYFFSTGDIHIANLKALIGGAPLKLSVKSLAVVSDALNISDIQAQTDVYFDQFRYRYSQSLVQASQVQWQKYLIEDFKGQVADNGKGIRFSDITGRFYGGSVLLKGWFAYTKKPPAYKVDIQINHVNSLLMAESNQAFSQLSAVVDGNIYVKDNSKGMIVRADLLAPEGGQMKASLLRYLAQYVPQRKQIEDLIDKDADVPLTQASLVLNSLSFDQLSCDILLNSASLNLKMQVKFDINIEGGLDSLLQSIH